MGRTPSVSVPGKACRYRALNGTLVQHLSHARELGSHLNYGRTRCAPTVVQRAQRAREFLTRLARSAVPLPLKITMLQRGAFASAVWGSEASHVSRKTTLQVLTTSVARVLKPKCNNEHDKRNPYLTCLFAGGGKSTTIVFESLLKRRVQAVRSFLARADAPATDRANSILEARCAGAALPEALPVHLLRETWADAGWALGSEWHLSDRSGSQRADLLRCSLQEVNIPTKEATVDWISLKARSRRELAALQHIDFDTAMAFPNTLGPLAKGRLVSALTGLPYTQSDYHKISGGEEDSLCSCGMETDSYEHRYLRCPNHADLRAGVPELLPPVSVDIPLATFGIAQCLPEEVAYHRYLETSVFQPVPAWSALPIVGESDDFLDFFSDGSAGPADDPRWRVAGSGITWRESVGGQFVWRQYSTPLPGLVSTITRAELLPLILVLEIVDRAVRFFVDNRSVVVEAQQRIAAAGRGLLRPYACQPNGDLWQRFDRALLAFPDRWVLVLNVKGHVDPDTVVTPNPRILPRR